MKGVKSMLELGRYEEERFDELKRRGAHVVIDLINGTKFEGTIYSFDNAVVIIDVKDRYFQRESERLGEPIINLSSGYQLD